MRLFPAVSMARLTSDGFRRDFNDRDDGGRDVDDRDDGGHSLEHDVGEDVEHTDDSREGPVSESPETGDLGDTFFSIPPLVPLGGTEKDPNT